MLARAADFQAAWYLSLLVIVIFAIVAGASGWAFVGARRMWREGDRGPAGLLIAVTVFSFLAFLGMFSVALVGVLLKGVASGGAG